MDQTLHQKRRKQDAGWIQNGAKLAPKAFKMESRGCQIEAKWRPKCIEKSMLEKGCQKGTEEKLHNLYDGPFWDPTFGVVCHSGGGPEKTQFSLGFRLKNERLWKA